MADLNVSQLQARLGVKVDGAIGPATLGALFARAGAASDVAAELGLAANVHFRTYGILESGKRLTHFMAQCAHESGGFRFNREIWGPTPAQVKYEGRADLGNDQRGDGFRYLGRGPGQLTGRDNYRRYGRLLGIDFESHPELVEIWSIGLLAFCAYWDRLGLNAFADQDSLIAVSNGINRGDPHSARAPNGLDDRADRFTATRKLIL